MLCAEAPALAAMFVGSLTGLYKHIIARHAVSISLKRSVCINISRSIDLSSGE